MLFELQHIVFVSNNHNNSIVFIGSLTTTKLYQPAKKKPLEIISENHLFSVHIINLYCVNSAIVLVDRDMYIVI
jgi:hypothetical protein